MVLEFKDVPGEVDALRGTGIFDIKYTHVTGHGTRRGVEMSGKLQAPRLAIASGTVPFSGEHQLYTYFFCAYHVSVSEYPDARENNNWRFYVNYLGYGSRPSWTMESSIKSLEWLESEKIRIRDESYCFVDFQDPDRRTRLLIKIDEVMELEKLHQERFALLGAEEREEILHPQPEVYVFGKDLERAIAGPVLFGQAMHRYPHPFVPAEINLKRYLKGMFTSRDVTQTQSWISSVAGRNVPVGSLDALATWEVMNDFKIARHQG